MEIKDHKIIEFTDVISSLKKRIESLEKEKEYLQKQREHLEKGIYYNNETIEYIDKIIDEKLEQLELNKIKEQETVLDRVVDFFLKKDENTSIPLYVTKTVTKFALLLAGTTAVSTLMMVSALLVSPVIPVAVCGGALGATLITEPKRREERLRKRNKIQLDNYQIDQELDRQEEHRQELIEETEFLNDELEEVKQDQNKASTELVMKKNQYNLLTKSKEEPSPKKAELEKPTVMMKKIR